MMNQTRFEEALCYLAYGEIERQEKFLLDNGWTDVDEDGFVDPMTGQAHELYAGYLIARMREILTTLNQED